MINFISLLESFDTTVNIIQRKKNLGFNRDKNFFLISVRNITSDFFPTDLSDAPNTSYYGVMMKRAESLLLALPV